MISGVSGLGNRIWTSPGKQVFSVMMFQRVCSLIYGLFVQAYRPAGPDGIRKCGPCLKNERFAQVSYRSIPTQV